MPDLREQRSGSFFLCDEFLFPSVQDVQKIFRMTQCFWRAIVSTDLLEDLDINYSMVHHKVLQKGGGLCIC